jgi:AGCS family alanine or glycine:cation symporter
VLSLETVWAYGDMALGLMMVPNLTAVLLLSPKVAALSRSYFGE